MSTEGLRLAERILRTQEQHYAADSVAEAIVEQGVLERLWEIIENVDNLAEDFDANGNSAHDPISENVWHLAARKLRGTQG